MPNAPVAITVADVLFCLPAIEAKAEITKHGYVRHSGDAGLCPVIALARAAGRSYPTYTLLRYRSAALAMGVPFAVADVLARASDDPLDPLRAELEAYLSFTDEEKAT